jgi:two-component system sensor histidine kinase/response regulator
VSAAARHGQTTARVLLVDDEPRNLRLLEGILAPLGFAVDRAPDGEAALERLLGDDLPDLVLLDVNMPGPSGIEVCRRVKSAQKAYVPVVLITSMSQAEARLAGLEAGADDFLNRPVDASELRARVKSLLHTKRLHDELQERYEELRRLQEIREGMTQMLVHDLRNPLTAIVGHLELVEDGHVGPSAARECVSTARRSAGRLIDLVSCILDLGRLEAGEMRLDRGTFSIAPVLDEVAAELKPLLDHKRLQLSWGGHLPSALADRECLRRVVLNIVANAISFSPPRGRIEVGVVEEAGLTRIAVRDEGPGIGPADQARIFDRYSTGERPLGRKYSTGLGLAFCKLAVEAHGGTIGVESETGLGSTFWFTLPSPAAALAPAV